VAWPPPNEAPVTSATFGVVFILSSPSWLSGKKGSVALVCYSL
jgi:hypothetical protein